MRTTLFSACLMLAGLAQASAHVTTVPTESLAVQTIGLKPTGKAYPRSAATKATKPTRLLHANLTNCNDIADL